MYVKIFIHFGKELGVKHLWAHQHHITTITWYYPDRKDKQENNAC